MRDTRPASQSPWIAPALRRPQTLRRWSHEQEIKSFCTRGPWTRRSASWKYISGLGAYDALGTRYRGELCLLGPLDFGALWKPFGLSNRPTINRQRLPAAGEIELLRAFSFSWRFSTRWLCRAGTFGCCTLALCSHIFCTANKNSTRRCCRCLIYLSNIGGWYRVRTCDPCRVNTGSS